MPRRIQSRQNGDFINVSFDPLLVACPNLAAAALATGTHVLQQLGLEGGGDFWLGILRNSGRTVWWHFPGGIYIAITDHGLTIKRPDGSSPQALTEKQLGPELYDEIRGVAQLLLDLMRKATGGKEVEDMAAPAAPAPTAAPAASAASASTAPVATPLRAPAPAPAGPVPDDAVPAAPAAPTPAAPSAAAFPCGPNLLPVHLARVVVALAGVVAAMGGEGVEVVARVEHLAAAVDALQEVVGAAATAA
ncbi:hypothetical protein HXX76_010744 [Chlamydomonas incerta]|uniref:Uncharacterized protein n=1 Tax=Chlamydomonas incerta TaxID=51695 RepID=A0A835VXS2_CHLIN|nr:hypothetical protein HXX76_010744 [Chlamydomonas incerta]|eukprot:KAG2429509.1 hypothetical protein HXX76_010744 [Chlamydomonas incerta]